MSVRRHGTLKKWNDDRGFGFIEPNEGPPQIFVHVKAYGARAERPKVNERVTFDVETTADGKTRAVNVRLLGATSEAKPASSPALLAIPLLLIGAAALVPILPVLGIPALAYVVMSLICYQAYREDKSAAQTGNWRVSEGTLHMLSLLGGWPGALYAQRRLRHKTLKASFQTAFWVTVMLNVAGLLWLIAMFANSSLSREFRP